MPRPLFVYGTLRDPELLLAILGRIPATRSASAHGFAALTYPGRIYPALVPDPVGEATGLLLDDLIAFERELLDAYEGDEYYRAALRVRTLSAEVYADAYLPTKDIGTAAPAWRLENWQRNHKPDALVIELTAAAALKQKLVATRREPSMTTDILDTALGPLAMTPINHASLVLSWGDQVLYFDPVGPLDRFAGLPTPTHLVLTHHHDDHLDVPTLNALFHDGVVIIAPPAVHAELPSPLQAATRVMKNGDHLNLGAFALDAIPMYNMTPERTKFHAKGAGNGYVLSFGGKRIYVAGDTEDTPELRALHDIDVAFIPMNLPYTQTGEQAAAGVKAFKPKIVYPFHYFKDGPEPARFAAAMAGFPGVEIRQRDWYRFE